MLLSTSQRELIVHVILIAIVIFVTMYAVMLLRRRAEAGRGAMAPTATGSSGGGGNGGDTDEMFTTAKLLHAANATVYGSRQCGYTVRQMERFGSHADMVEYIECGEQSACEGIRGFPTWKIGSETLMGDQPLRTLRAAAERVLNNSQPSQKQQRGPAAGVVAGGDSDFAESSSDGLLAIGADDDAFHPTL
jgi:hypothetical protein